MIPLLCLAGVLTYVGIAAQQSMHNKNIMVVVGCNCHSGILKRGVNQRRKKQKKYRRHNYSNNKQLYMTTPR